MSIDETALGRWSRLKKARKDRATDTDRQETSASPATPHGHGSAAPTAFPVDVSGEYRPWLPPLTDGEGGDVVEPSPIDAAPSDAIPEISEEDRAVAAEMGLPDIETLKEESDFSVFLSDKVPDTLRRLALRKLWASNPFFGIRDGLNDYDEDFRALSDFVYNSDAMKRFTEGPKEPPEQASEETKSDINEDASAQKGEGTPAEDDETQAARTDASSTERDESAELEVTEDDDDALGDDDPELG